MPLCKHDFGLQASLTEALEQQTRPFDQLNMVEIARFGGKHGIYRLVRSASMMCDIVSMITNMVGMIEKHTANEQSRKLA